jgi:TRAP-type mannitol/chloroaromatic compound transport system substrate-binding protein
MGGWFNKEINSLADIQGLKMRIPGLGGSVFNRAGGLQVLMPGSELYTNLERGVIDATEWLGPYHDTLMGFHEIAEYYYTPGWHEPGTALEFFINKEKYDQLTPDLKAIFYSAGYHVHLWCWQEMEKRNAEALSGLVDKGIKLRQFPKDVIEEYRRITKLLFRSWSIVIQPLLRYMLPLVTFSRKLIIMPPLRRSVFIMNCRWDSTGLLRYSQATSTKRRKDSD